MDYFWTHKYIRLCEDTEKLIGLSVIHEVSELEHVTFNSWMWDLQTSVSITSLLFTLSLK